MEEKIRRNDPCWCGSGKKYKRCHLGTPADEQRLRIEASMGEFGARSIRHSLNNLYKEKRSGTISGKSNLPELLNKIIEGKGSGNRPRPSKKLVLGRSKVKDELRKSLIDSVGEIVDQNWCGRSEMCVYFAILLGDVLRKLNMNSIVVIGKGTYTDLKDPSNMFTWDHGWILIDDEIIDGNVDSMVENPAVPKGIEPKNYWGPINELPSDRKLVKDKEIGEGWIKKNTDYGELQKWRNQLDQKLKDLGIC